MEQATHSTIVNFIWGIADDVLRDVYVRGKYRDVILPMTVIRRLDSLLEPTKDAVLEQKEFLDSKGILTQEGPLRQAAKQAFYNTSQFTLRRLLDNPKQLRANFTDYLDGFSANVQEIVDKFDFHNQLKKLEQADALGQLIEKFLAPNINLSPRPVLDGQGTVKFPGLDNHGMGTVFEELIRKFNEENNEEAGEHWTPRDVVHLMANLIFLPVKDAIQSGTYLVYDGACGTGGMLTVADEVLSRLAAQHEKDAAIHLYGQEINAETYAICKADLLLKGEGQEADNIKFGSTLAADAYPSQRFDFMLSNPPYGKSWKTDQERMGGKGELKDARFLVNHDGDPEFSLVTRSSDGQLMFLANMLSKMKHDTPLGSRIAEVHNGSSLFTGDAGSGESNIRRWIIENDWLEAVIALPLNMFYNTGIATYIWVLTNRKPAHRRGKVQLIDATEWYEPLRKNQGKKNCRFTDDHIRRLCDVFLNLNESEQSKVFPNDAFGFWKVTVERPLRVKGIDPHRVYTSKEIKAFKTEGLVDESGLPVVKRVHKKATADPLHGLLEFKVGGKTQVVEYEPDPDLRDTEQVPLLEDGGIEAFIRREVLPPCLRRLDRPVKHEDRLRGLLHPAFLQAPEAAEPGGDPGGHRGPGAANGRVARSDPRGRGGGGMKTALRPYSQYRDCGLPWLGRIPTHWQVRRNGYLFAQRNETGYGDLPILEVSIKSGVSVRSFDGSSRKQVMSDREKYKKAARGDVAYNMMRLWQGAVGVSPTDGLVSPAYVVAKPYPGTVSEYFVELFRTDVCKAEINKYSRGIVSDRNRLYWDEFKQMPVCVPPTEEQDAIVRYLNHADQGIRRFIQAKRRLIELINEQKQAITDSVLMQGLTLDPPRKTSGIHQIGDVPQHWKLRRFKFLARISRGQVDPRIVPYCDMQLVAPNHIESGTGKLIGRQTSTEQGAISGKYFVHKGQIMYSKIRPNLKKAVIAPEDCLCSADMYPITPNEAEVRTGFLLLLILSSSFTKYVVDCSMRVAMPKVNRGALADCWLLYPPLAEQDKILDCLASELDGLNKVTDRIRTEIILIREYHNRLIADIVTGKLDVREAAERLPRPVELEVPDDDTLGLYAGDPEETEGLDDDDPELLSVAADEE